MNKPIHIMYYGSSKNYCGHVETEQTNSMNECDVYNALNEGITVCEDCLDIYRRALLKVVDDGDLKTQFSPLNADTVRFIYEREFGRHILKIEELNQFFKDSQEFKILEAFKGEYCVRRIYVHLMNVDGKLHPLGLSSGNYVSDFDKAVKFYELYK